MPDDPNASHHDSFVDDADDEETASLRALFPDGNPAKADEWKALFARKTDQ